ncbi:DUF3244 domain-containing protein [Parabacteroides sp. OttesenSCG-928-G07]|nr:DUF3244 domain-containing protein [Parabacteroides sp. OttesenSCG-928-G07]
MNLLSRISTISVIVFVCLCNVFEAKADRDKEILMEAKLGKKGMRSLDTAVGIETIGNDILLTFYKDARNIMVDIRDESNKSVYRDFFRNSNVEYIPALGWKSGYYILEIRLDREIYYECIYIE